MTEAEVRDVQESCDRFTKKYLKGVAPLHVDGKKGHATNSRIMACKFYLGYGKSRDSRVSSVFIRRLRHPHSRKYSTRQMLATGAKRRLAQRNQWRANQVHAVVTPGVTRYDGVPVAKCAVPILNWCRQHGWHGRLVSGWRSPWYSDSLCRRICGRPSCPGVCAGRASNHSGNSPARFALDVSQYGVFRQVVANCPVRPHIHNSLPRDPVHFSPSGR